MNRQFRELADVHYGKGPSEVLSEDGPFPVVGTGGVYGRAKSALFSGPAVVVARKGSLGNPQFMGDAFWPVDTTYAVVPKAGIDAKWLYYNLDMYDLTKLNEATGVPSISRDWLYRIEFDDPGCEQQKKIAEILSTLDEAIEQTEALIAKMQQVKAGLMHDLFTRGVTPDGRLRPTRKQAPELYKDSPLGWIPKEWEVKPLDNHVRIIDCKHYTPEFRTEGYPFIRPRNVKVDGLDLEGVDYVSSEDFQLLTDVYRPRRGDIVFSRNASFGVPCFVDTDVLFAIGQDVVIMTEKASETRFVFYALTTSITSAQIAKVSAGSTFGRINLGEIRKLLIPQPGNKEQQRICDRLVAYDVRVKELKAEVCKLRQQKQGLMHDLMTGKVRVNID